MTSRAVFTAGLLVAAQVFAQSAPPPPPVAEPPPALPPPPAERTTPAAPAPTPPPTPAPRPQVGFRAGGSAGLGVFLPTPAMFSIQPFDLHGGAQFSPLFGAYLRVGYSASIGLGLSANSMGGSVSVSGAGFWLIGANAELGLGDSFFIAAGPQVGFGAWSRNRVSASTTGGGSGAIESITSTGAQPGFDFKIGFGLGQPNRLTGRRAQATVALDLSLLYATQVVQVGVMGGAQGGGVAVSFGEALSVIPTLQVGFEFR